MIKDFISLTDFSSQQLSRLLRKALDDKKAFQAGRLAATLERKTLAMIFEKPSLRTRVSFETAMTHLGGHAIYLTKSDIGLGQRESIADGARTLGRMCDGIMARTFKHEYVVQLAAHARVPVINALTDYSHPCQAMADIMTLQELMGADLSGRKLVFVGDGNNVARSLAMICSRLGIEFVLACPRGYEFEKDFASKLDRGATLVVTDDTKAAVAGADAIYTDTWVSMGQEAEKAKRVEVFRSFQVNAKLMAAAGSQAVVLHCLPAYRGYEITDETFEAHAETIFRQAENRLHFQRSLLDVLIGQGGIE
ncbi:MAG: ornithine carbamoyltransferase [Planctomycetaceae bacterium]|nr:ornithine carbamoyltransferase [Planctomycetaceae bacterium]